MQLTRKTIKKGTQIFHKSIAKADNVLVNRLLRPDGKGPAPKMKESGKPEVEGAITMEDVAEENGMDRKPYWLHHRKGVGGGSKAPPLAPDRLTVVN